jgi:hypothetical protein
METLSTIWGWTKSLLDVLGYPATIIIVVGLIVKVVRRAKGVVPVGMRIGKGLSSRKIALFAKGDGLVTLREVVLRSSLFSEENLIGVPNLAEFANHEGTDFFIVYYPDWKEDFNKILKQKTDQIPLLVYCPSGAERIDQSVMEKIDLKRNTAVSNFRGRLLNDIFTAMITTNYEK